MDWQQLVWWATGSKGVRKSLAATVLLLGVWSIAAGPLVEWRQQMYMDRLQPAFDRFAEIGAPASVPTPTP